MSCKYGGRLHLLATGAEEGKVTQKYIKKIVIIIYGVLDTINAMYYTTQIIINNASILFNHVHLIEGTPSVLMRTK